MLGYNIITIYLICSPTPFIILKGVETAILINRNRHYGVYTGRELVEYYQFQ